MVFYVLFAILMFGVLIAVHEFGHFITAKWLGVQVNEFAIGMGPQIWSKVKGDTLYSWRLFPIGGYCAMEGEDSDSDNPAAFTNKAGWKKLIILLAGAFMNFLTGLLIVLVLISGNEAFAYESVVGFTDGSPLTNSVLQVGDRFLSVDGHQIFAYGDASYFLTQAGDIMDLVVERDGQRISLVGVDMTPYAVEHEGETLWLRGLTIGPQVVEATSFLMVKQAFLHTFAYARMVWMSLGDLVSGAVGIQEMSGAIGIVNIMGEAGEAGAAAATQAGTSAILGAMTNILYFTAFIAVNLAVMNLLPIPALDGGRIFFLAVNEIYTMIAKKKLDPKYEGYVNMAGFATLIALMVVVAFNDVLRLIQ